MRYLSGDTENHDHEVDEAAWFEVRAAKKALKYVNEKRLVELAIEQLERIVQNQLRALDRKLEEDRELHLAATPAAVDLLARLSYDPEYGARPAGRVLQREVLSPLAEILLSGDALPGSTIHIDAVAQEPEAAEPIVGEATPAAETTPDAPEPAETDPVDPIYELVFTISTPEAQDTLTPAADSPAEAEAEMEQAR